MLVCRHILYHARRGEVRVTKPMGFNVWAAAFLSVCVSLLLQDAQAVDDCDHCTVAICSTCSFNTDGRTACHTCENCCLRQGRVIQWKRENKYDGIWSPELHGEFREDQVGTSDVPVGGILQTEQK